MSKLKRILLVDDDEDFIQSLTERFEIHEEFQVTPAVTGAEAVKKAKPELFDVILLDIGLPDMDGHEVCRVLRRDGVRIPIIVLSGADTEADTVLGLESGANDYVTKPFRFGVLNARIRAHLRQHEQCEDAVFTIGRYTFHPAARVMLIEKENKKVRLTAMETAILKYLYRAGTKPVSRDLLLNEVWGYNPEANTHTLETHIYRLRQKIERDPSSADLLVTDAGGYRLVP